MSLDGKIATNTGESKWITGAKARAYGMRLRLGADAIVAGINTIVRDDPALSLRAGPGVRPPRWKQLRRVILDPAGRTPLEARVLADEHASLTTVVLGPGASEARASELERRARTIRAPAWENGTGIDLRAVLQQLEREGVTSVLVEGGGETHHRFLEQGLVQRVHFMYAPAIVTGRGAAKAVGGAESLNGGAGLPLRQVEWKTLGNDLLMTGRVD
jgi:diaminohydroxyphosphoribosylaminopyrimidine deaminase/5-amino-6-(5-phosphoribosylamino)uracil reductase